MADLSKSEIEKIVRRFEKAHDPANPPAIDDFLTGDGPPRWALLLELVHSDLELRLQADQPVALADYLARYPELENFPEELARILETEVKHHTQADRPIRLSAYEAAYPQLGKRVRGIFRRVGDAPPEVPGYELLEKIGEGGMGAVYRARQEVLRREVAVKVVLGKWLGDAVTRERITRRMKKEPLALAKIKHPNVVQVFDTGEHVGDLFLVMELIRGRSLQERLDKGGVLPPTLAAEWMGKVARAIQAAHDAGVIHRDLKPDNVLLEDDHEPKVVDFGLARPVVPGDGVTVGPSNQLEGTPAYLSPEQAMCKDELITPLVDVHGLGAVLYACLTGRPPFVPADLLTTLRDVKETVPVAVREMRPEVPRDLETICMKCLQKEPGKRYSSAAALADDLQRFLNGEPILARPVGPLERTSKWVKRNKTVTIAGLAVAAALLAGTAVSVWQAVRATRAAEREAEQKGVADAKAEDAKKAEAVAVAEANRATAAERQLRSTIAKQWLRSMGASTKQLTRLEVEVLDDIRERCDPDLFVHILDAVSADDGLLRGFAARTPAIVKAAVGTDEGVRTRVETALVRHFLAPATDATRREVYLQGLLSLGGLTEATSRVILEPLKARVVRASNDAERVGRVRELITCAIGLPPSETTEVLSWCGSTRQSQEERGLYFKALAMNQRRLPAKLVLAELIDLIRTNSDGETRVALVRLLASELSRSTGDVTAVCREAFGLLDDARSLAAFADWLYPKGGGSNPRHDISPAAFAARVVARAESVRVSDPEFVIFACTFTRDRTVARRFGDQYLADITSKTDPRLAKSLYSDAMGCFRAIDTVRPTDAQLDRLIKMGKSVLDADYWTPVSKLSWLEVLFDIGNVVPSRRDDLRAAVRTTVEELLSLRNAVLDQEILVRIARLVVAADFQGYTEESLATLVVNLAIAASRQKGSSDLHDPAFHGAYRELVEIMDGNAGIWSRVRGRVSDQLRQRQLKIKDPTILPLWPINRGSTNELSRHWRSLATSVGQKPTSYSVNQVEPGETDLQPLLAQLFSPVSDQEAETTVLRQLERQLGVPLFDRWQVVRLLNARRSGK